MIMMTLNVIRGMGINSMWQKNMPYYRKLLRQWADAIESGALKGCRCEIR
jgi:hypothetical protein